MNGILIVDKPTDFTSFDVVAVIRKTLHEKKTGHTGTLDPMATGVLPILLGNATKVQQYLSDTDKEYICSFKFGITTDTLDITGKIINEYPANVTQNQIEDILSKFRGDILQKPPMYSAVSKNGVRLYELARKGIEIEREARPVTISKLELLEFDESTQCGKLQIACSKGTYIRVICDDIGKELQCGCVMTALRRTKACGFDEGQAIPLQNVRELGPDGVIPYIKPVESIFAHIPQINITEKQAFRFSNGGNLMLSRLKDIPDKTNDTLYRVCYQDKFIGLGSIDTENDELKFEKKF
ncbi:MAG: tRNA pseudouridine(55) synthase TruB [Clostridia bacterium]|nr:tRNA pseudouridine(55) synthase TruB [Clostridia bacterium]